MTGWHARAPSPQQCRNSGIQRRGTAVRLVLVFFVRSFQVSHNLAHETVFTVSI